MSIVTDSVTMHSTYITSICVGASVEYMDKLLTIGVVSLTPEYVKVLSYIDSEYPEVSEEAAARLFQIVAEIMLATHCVSPDTAPSDTNPEMLDDILGEMELSLHSIFTIAGTYNIDLVHGVVTLMEELLLARTPMVHKLPNGYYVPLRWVLTSGTITIHIGVIEWNGLPIVA